MRWPFFIISIISLLGAALLLFFNILCGASTSSVLGKWYWLEAGTSNIPGAQQTTRWTNYAACGVTNGRNSNCSSTHAAYPMSPVSNFGTTQGVPPGLQSKRGVTYYLSKVGWAFLLIGLFFTLLALLPVIFGTCFPSLSVLNIGSSVTSTAAFVFTALSASLLTAGYVKARNAFRSNGQHTQLGKTMLAFIWTSTFLLALSSIFSCLGWFGVIGKKKRTRRSDEYETSSHETYGNNYIQEKEQTKKKRGLFGRKKQENLEDVGYAAGLGASGATSNVTGGANTRTVEPTTGDTYTRTPQNQTRGGVKSSGNPGVTAATATTAGVVGAAGVAAYASAKGNSKKEFAPTSGAGDPTMNDQTYNAKTGETLDDVALAAGYGASGATSDITKKNATTNKSDNAGISSNDYAVGTTTAPYGSGNSQTVRDGNPHGAENGGYVGTDTPGTLGTANYGSSNNASSGEAYGSSGISNTKMPQHADENLEDVGYAAGLGASGATSKYTDSTSKATTIDTANDSTKERRSSPARNGIWATAASALGFGAAGAASTKDAEDTHDTNPSIAGIATDSGSSKDVPATGDNSNTTALENTNKAANSSATPNTGVQYNQNGADLGPGATKIGANQDKVNRLKGVYENKSTAQPVDGTIDGKRANQGQNGNTTADFDKGVSETASASASEKGIGYNMPVKEGPATSVEDTYKTTHVPGEHDLTTTTAYQPTGYYSRATHDKFAKDSGTTHEWKNLDRGAVAGADTGAALGYTADKYSKSANNFDDHGAETASTGESLEDSAYSNGNGSSRAKSDVPKRSNKASNGRSTGVSVTDTTVAGATANGSGTTGYSGYEKSNIPGTKAGLDDYDAENVKNGYGSESGYEKSHIPGTKSGLDAAHDAENVRNGPGNISSIGKDQNGNSSKSYTGSKYNRDTANPSTDTGDAFNLTAGQTISSKGDEIPGSFEPPSPIQYADEVDSTTYKTGTNGKAGIRGDDEFTPRDLKLDPITGDRIDEATGKRYDAYGNQKGLVDTVIDNVKSVI